MPTNINPNYQPGSEANNQLYNTQIPSLTDDANIQEALRLYHYGSADVLPANNSNIATNSIAGYLRGLRTSITTLENIGSASEFAPLAPTAPVDGYIWVDSTSNAPTVDLNALPYVAIYQASEPTGATQGMLWVDSDDNTLYAYSGASWVQVSSSGSSTAPVAGGLSLTGLGIDVSAASGGQFQFNPGTGLQYFAFAVDSTTTKCLVSLSIGAAVSASGVGQIILQRVLNNDPLTTTTVAAFTYGNGNLQFSYLDEHNQVAGTDIAYILTNATTDTVTFSSANSSAIQISLQEIS